MSCYLDAAGHVADVRCPWYGCVWCVKVALCSAHYALLTPVTEAFLALLFPFVWQVNHLTHRIETHKSR